MANAAEGDDLAAKVKPLSRINPYTQAPSVCNTDTDEFAILPGMTISKEYPVPCELIPGVEALVKPDLVVHKNGIEFTSVDNARIRAEW